MLTIKPMLPMPATEPLLREMINRAGSVIVQPKLDGIRLIWDGHLLYTRQGHRVRSLPHISTELMKHFHGEALDGEAYRHGWSWPRILGAVMRNQPNAASREIQFHAFDLIDGNATQEDRLIELRQRKAENREALGSLHLNPGIIKELDSGRTQNLARIRDELQAFLDGGYEGIIIRDPHAAYTPGKTPCVLKWKPGRFDEYKVIMANVDSNRVTRLLAEDADGNKFETEPPYPIPLPKKQPGQDGATLPYCRVRVQFLPCWPGMEPSGPIYKALIIDDGKGCGK